ncbi:MAG TPA: alpha/beta hydrolase [Candidatus Saccharimonadales bacterium]|nr:alpha/beta hydrolase [Candidatus Saccharimonadales bacterium]
MAEKTTIVLVHGAFADASGFAGVIKELETAGYDVVAPPNPLRGLISDAESIAVRVKAIEGPVVLAGHSYGGAVISQASASLNNVKALVFMAAFALDVGESGASVQEPFPAPMLVTTNAPTNYDAPGAAGGPDLYIGKAGFHETFCADSPADLAEIMYVTQRPLAAATLSEKATAAGWKKIPSWFLVSDKDNAISPKAEAFMAERMKATTEHIDGSHTAFIAQPTKVAAFIQKAAAS